jgi:hypothetical protein
MSSGCAARAIGSCTLASTNDVPAAAETGRIAARLGRRAGRHYVLTGVTQRNPFRNGPPRLSDAWVISYVHAQPAAMMSLRRPG